MSLEKFLKNGWLKKHETSPMEIENLLNIVDRDLKDAKANNISDDWRFGMAYNASLKLCTILLAHSGYRVDKIGFHYKSIRAAKALLPKNKSDWMDFLDACRSKRNETEYDFIGGIGESDVYELLEFAEEFKIWIIEKINPPSR